MPRRARILSETGIYHVIVRGVSKQVIFEEDYDYVFFLSKLRNHCKETGVRVIAYCLMSNHVHMLLYDPSGNLSLVMKKMGVSYSGYFNRKYDRVGHLFQDRFLSEVITSERQLMIVIRYIINNPQKAGLGPATDYKWSSYHAYRDGTAIVDIKFLNDIFGDEEHYVDFITEASDDKCLDYGTIRRNDEWAKSLIRKLTGEQDVTNLRSYEKKQRDKKLRELRERGVSIRQLERLTGISRGIIQET